MTKLRVKPCAPKDVANAASPPRCENVTAALSDEPPGIKSFARALVFPSGLGKSSTKEKTSSTERPMKRAFFMQPQHADRARRLHIALPYLPAKSV